jgi:hypothetical protein
MSRCFLSFVNSNGLFVTKLLHFLQIHNLTLVNINWVFLNRTVKEIMMFDIYHFIKHSSRVVHHLFFVESIDHKLKKICSFMESNITEIRLMPLSKTKNVFISVRIITLFVHSCEKISHSKLILQKTPL